MANGSDSDSMSLSWRIKERAGFTTVEFSGEIDENTDFSELTGRLTGNVVFQLQQVRRINSCGVREWVNFVRDLPTVTELTFTHCSPAIVTQLNMIYNFRGGAKLRSFYAPYICDECDVEEEKLLDIESNFGEGKELEPPEFTCQTCKGPLEFDDLPDHYLAFLSEV
jgi:anti-anti-sigma regulatory factor